MPRRNSAKKRSVLPDPKFNSTIVSKLINQIMLDGKKGIAQHIVYSAFDKVEAKLGQSGYEAFLKALENIMPVVETKARRVGGSTYQVPSEVRPERRQTLGIRMLVTYARKRSEYDMDNKLSAEIVDAFNSTGGAFKKKEEIHKMAEANKAFAHYRY